jgi:hypothetical protein
MPNFMLEKPIPQIVLKFLQIYFFSVKIIIKKYFKMFKYN